VRLKLDENLPAAAAALLRARGFEADTVHDEGLVGRSDDVVWQAAPDHEQWRASDYLVAWLTDPEAQSWQRCVVVATPNKVRVLRPLVER